MLEGCCPWGCRELWFICIQGSGGEPRGASRGAQGTCFPPPPSSPAPRTLGGVGGAQDLRSLSFPAPFESPPSSIAYI